MVLHTNLRLEKEEGEFLTGCSEKTELTCGIEVERCRRLQLMVVTKKVKGRTVSGKNRHNRSELEGSCVFRDRRVETASMMLMGGNGADEHGP